MAQVISHMLVHNTGSYDNVSVWFELITFNRSKKYLCKCYTLFILIMTYASRVKLSSIIK
jgi:hypothetical protein